ncbi:MAG: polysaccharide deacetylase family protein, partial [Acutalibacteraceae bacterium]|nr:polysaccharide deacetylase family protein [Acutalibacteraceae bacterium]
MTFKEQQKKKAVTFSFDDGVTQDIRMVELLNKYGLLATFNVNSDLLSQRGILDRNGKRISHYKLHPEDVKFVYDGHEVAAHTLTHPLLPAIKDENEIIRQVEKDREKLSELAGYEVIGMAYPCGGENNDDRVAEIIKNNTGIKYARTIKSVYDFELQTNLFRFNPSVYYLHFDKMMELGQKFVDLKTDKPQIFYIWGHSYEMDFEEDYWVKFEEFLKLISGKEDIFYGTNKEVLL